MQFDSRDRKSSFPTPIRSCDRAATMRHSRSLHGRSRVRRAGPRMPDSAGHGTTPYRGRNLLSKLGMRSISYGSTAAIVTNMALVMGLDAAMASRLAIVSALLVIAIADNLTDSLSIHIYQESEALESRKAFVTTLANYAARLVVSCSFLPIVLLPVATTLVVTLALVWGMLLLAAITYLLAKQRHARVIPELTKHLSVALLAILTSRLIGMYISRFLA